jgi:hypothetical protein
MTKQNGIIFGERKPEDERHKHPKICPYCFIQKFGQPSTPFLTKEVKLCPAHEKADFDLFVKNAEEIDSKVEKIIGRPDPNRIPMTKAQFDTYQRTEGDISGIMGVQTKEASRRDITSVRSIASIEAVERITVQDSERLDLSIQEAQAPPAGQSAPEDPAFRARQAQIVKKLDINPEIMRVFDYESVPCQNHPDRPEYRNPKWKVAPRTHLCEECRRTKAVEGKLRPDYYL